MVEIYLLLTPLLVGGLCATAGSRKVIHLINLVGAACLLLAGLSLAGQVFTSGPKSSFGGVFYVDALGGLMLLIITLIAFVACLYSIAYMGYEVAHGHLKEANLRWYYLLLYIFIFTMYLVVMVNNLGVMWVAIEGTTLASALLVGFYRKAASLEAAWKYIIICTVGIIFALFGTILSYYSAVNVFGEVSDALNWTTLVQAAPQLDVNLLKLAFIFILVGYGTKAGIVPMHTWLPDAHSQAPSPISALLSGVLLNCALYGIIRFHIIVSHSPLGSAYSQHLLLVFGLLSVGVAVPFILLQYDIKRLLAYSSVEHIGIIMTGLGFGGKLGIYGAVLHLFNHAVSKSFLFFIAGSITQKYNTKKIAKIQAAVRTMPVSGSLLLLGCFAIAGAPPFSIFVSEMTILNAGFSQASFGAAALFLIFISLIFAGMIYYVIKMAFGAVPGRIGQGEITLWANAVIILPVLLIIGFGLYIPPFVDNIIAQVMAVIQGGL